MRADMTPVHITDAVAEGVLPLADAVAVVEQAFRDLGAGEAANLARVRSRCAGKTLSAMGALLPRSGVLGAKVYPTIGGRFNFVIALFDAETGRLLATLQGDAVTGIRTCATTIVAARRLARQDARTLAVFGSGVQARAHAHAFAEFFPLREVVVLDPHGDPQALARDLMARHGLSATVARDARTALATADIVVTCTRSETPLFEADAVADGTFIAAIGSSKPDTRELPPALLERAGIIAVEDKSQALGESGDLAGVEAARVLALGDLLGDRAPVAAPSAISIYKSVGIGVEDVAVAHAIWQRLAARAAAG